MDARKFLWYNSVGTFALAGIIFCRSNRKRKGKWKPIILWRLRLGATSLTKLERDIDGITQKMLLEQLKELMDYGFVEKKSYEGYPLRVEYSLTDGMGREILEALRIMQHIGIDYLKANGMEHILEEKGVIQPQYGGHGTQFNENGIPTYSLPFKVEDAPQGTVSIAIVLEGKDAYPVTGGFAWIHWLAANITRFEIKENESQTAEDFVQGRNSWTSIQGGEQSAELSCYYGGMTPSDKPHIYELHVYALDKMLDLERGFLLNELYCKMDGHILDQFTLKGIYEN